MDSYAIKSVYCFTSEKLKRIVLYMRIAIVTTEQAANYGGVMQNFALQHCLKKLGHAPITLDRIGYTLSVKRYILAQGKTLMLRMLGKTNRKFYSGYPPVLQRNNDFNGFVSRFIKTSRPFLSYPPRILKKLHADVVIVGSDQVWRRAYYSPNLILDHFLRFAEDYDIKRIAYAASFGVDELDYEEPLAEQCKELLHKFDAVSVREHSGVDICKKSFDVEAQLMPDPTLLLDREDYEALCADIPQHKDRYLLSYLLDMDERMKEAVIEFAQKRGLSVVFCTSDADEMPSIEEWLALHRDAEFVITNSFHGTVFSIIFNKEFYAVVNSERGASRFTSLLSQLGLENHLLNTWKTFNNEYKKIDWERVNALRQKLQHKGTSYLEEHLNLASL